MRVYRFLSIFLVSVLLLTFCSAVPVHAQPVWNVQTVDANGAESTGSPIALDSNNVPHVAYTDFSRYCDKYDDRIITFDVKYASWNGAIWANQTIGTGVAVV